MLTLVETLTGFAAIMLMLSLLVKTLTSVIKNQLDYYSDNLKHEVQRLVLETTGKTWETLIQNPTAPDWVRDIHWERLGDEFLTPAYMSWFLRQLDQNARVFDIESRLKIHISNVNYTFQMRMKNLALAAGLGLCLLCNINALTIWKALYTDQQLRATFSGSYADKATKLADEQAAAATSNSGQKATDAQIRNFQTNMRGFLTDVSFGVGKIWESTPPTDKPYQGQKTQPAQGSDQLNKTGQPQPTSPAQDAGQQQQTAPSPQSQPEKQTNRQPWKGEKSPLQTFLYEFFGSLLTGILVSIGAPYWHDFLQALANFRPAKGKA